MTTTECKAALQSVIAAAVVVIGRANAGDYTSVPQAEADINAVRTSIAALMPEISTLWGADGAAALSALRGLAARLLDLRALVTDTGATITEATDQPSNAMSLAVLWYGDYSRWTELLDLNLDLAWPGRMPAATSLVRHVR